MPTREERKASARAALEARDAAAAARRAARAALDAEAAGNATAARAARAAATEAALRAERERRDRAAAKRAQHEERTRETLDPPEELERKIEALVALARDASAAGGLVVHTGAGTSTSAGIPDYRGPGGVRTLGRKAHTGAVDLGSARPTSSHMALAALARAGNVALIATQNVDGLHRRAGTPPACLVELHGCVYDMRCAACGHVRTRTAHEAGSAGRELAEEYCAAGDGADAGVSTVQDVADGDHTQSARDAGDSAPGGSSDGRGAGNSSNAGASKRLPRGAVRDSRVCPSCGASGEGTWRDTIVRFGQRLAPERLARAADFSARAPLSLVVGSSLKVPPACTLPRRSARYVIVNLQWTKYDARAAIVLRARADDVLPRLARALGVCEGELAYDPALDPLACAEVAVEGVVGALAGGKRDASAKRKR